jgi:hypothetical protein
MRRLTSAESKLSTHSAFATNESPIQPQKPQQNTPRNVPKCLCGERHWYGECYYFNPTNARPENWQAETQENIKKALRADSELAKKVKNALTRHASYLRRHANEQASGTNEESLGAFTASYSVAEDYKLKNYWLLDSGSDIHVTNTPQGFMKTSESTENDQIIAGGSAYTINAFGRVNIDVKTPTGERSMTLLHVAYVPGFMANLVSLSRLVSKGVYWST